MDTLEKFNKRTLEIELHNITPFLSHGANKELEFRIPELKAAMRYWWRAFQWYDSVEEMKKEEEKYFGSQKEKSPLVFIPKTICQEEEAVDMRYKLNKKHKEFLYTNLLELTSILGGVGGKSAKGYGAFCVSMQEKIPKNLKLLSYDTKELLTRKKLVEKVKQDINYVSNIDNIIGKRNIEEEELKVSISFPERKRKPDYPYIEKIVIGNPILKDNFLKQIREAVSNSNKEAAACKYKKDRHPIIISCYKSIDDKKNILEVFPIISFFHYTNNVKPEIHQKYYDKLIKEIIG